jgi:hypothetical protein
VKEIEKHIQMTEDRPYVHYCQDPEKRDQIDYLTSFKDLEQRYINDRKELLHQIKQLQAKEKDQSTEIGRLTKVIIGKDEAELEERKRRKDYTERHPETFENPQMSPNVAEKHKRSLAYIRAANEQDDKKAHYPKVITMLEIISKSVQLLTELFLFSQFEEYPNNLLELARIRYVHDSAGDEPEKDKFFIYGIAERVFGNEVLETCSRSGTRTVDRDSGVVSYFNKLDEEKVQYVYDLLCIRAGAIGLNPKERKARCDRRLFNLIFKSLSDKHHAAKKRMNKVRSEDSSNTD